MTDILLGEDLDLVFRNGDLVIAESTEQHQKLILLNDKGHVKQHPLTGVGIMGYVNDDNLGGLYQEIQKQFDYDGLRVDRLDIYEDGTMNIKASYE